MELQNHREFDATREKLRLLEERCETAAANQGGNEHLRTLSTRSLKRLINQMKEEIARFEAHRAKAHSD